MLANNINDGSVEFSVAVVWTVSLHARYQDPDTEAAKWK